MRQLISFVLATALFLVGGYSLYFHLFVASGWRGMFVMGAALMVFIGGAWLVSDFVLPFLRGKESE